jgi:hypothetical protein
MDIAPVELVAVAYGEAQGVILDHDGASGRPGRTFLAELAVADLVRDELPGDRRRRSAVIVVHQKYLYFIPAK